MSRPDGRGNDALRPVSAELGYQEWAAGSILFSMGKTRVLCAASVSDDPPRWLRGTGKGWVTGEYSMLPASTNERSFREVNKGRPGGRTQEIQRLIGRALRSVTDLRAMGERMITIDCDVLQADAGTRTASITGGYVALALALRGLEPSSDVLRDSVAAVSVGIVDGEARLDLCYEEDAGAEVDFNVVMTGDGRARRGAGHRRGRAVLARRTSTRCSTWRRPGSPSSPRSSRRRWRGAVTASRPGSRSPPATPTSSASSARICADWPVIVGHGRRPRPGRLPRRRGDRRHLPGERVAEGAGGGRGAGAAGARRRLRDRGRRPRAAGRARAAPGSQASTPPTRRTSGR